MAAIVERRSRPQVTVNLDDPKDGIVNRYTTGDEINFNVTVTVREDVMIGALQLVSRLLTKPSTYVQYRHQ